jgi:hypothetical protein
MLCKVKDNNEARTVDVRAHHVRRDLSLARNCVPQCCRRGIQCRINLKSWRQVGAVPFTKKCLENLKVRHDGTDNPDPTSMSIRTYNRRMTSASCS